MTPDQERAFLNESLKALESPTNSWSWQTFILEAFAFSVLAITALWIKEKPGMVDWLQVMSLVGIFAAGMLIGAIGLWRKLCHKGALIRPYIDTVRIRARLAELET